MSARAILIALALQLSVVGFQLSGADHLPEVTLPVHNGTLRIAVVGDTGIETKTISHAITAAKPFDAILLVGDNFYPCGVKSASDPKWRVLDALTSLDIPIYAVLGNHDYCGNPAAQVNANVPNWHMPAREYVIRTAVADFTVLDTTPYATGKSTAAEEAIRSVFGARTLLPAPRWRIVVGHHVVTSSGFHSIAPRDEARRMRRLLPVMRDNKVDLYLGGHDHHEELLDLKPPLIVVSGAGSDPVPMVTVRDQTVWPKTTHFREPIAFATVEITAQALTVEFLNARGVRVGGPFRYPK
jgi:tartrate-resistant acid phosphatase type 5